MLVGTVRRALLSVYDKQGLLDLAQRLVALKVELLASGGTGKALEEAGVPFTSVSAHTGAPEVLDGRVKTLHPIIAGGILGDRRNEAHQRQMHEHGIAPIDLVVCNLYPFVEARRRNADHTTMVETIDIGGPTLLRAAAKNADGGVGVVCDPADYPGVLAALESHRYLDDALRARLRAKAFRHVAEYDLAIAQWAEERAEEVSDARPELSSEPLPPLLTGFLRSQTLRYGENPHQPAALYIDPQAQAGVALGKQLAGKELSYNNYLDLDAAYHAATTGPGDVSRCAIVKHTNPCGLAEHAGQPEAFARALASDPLSAFGSVIGFNRPLEGGTARVLVESKLFVECIVAPGFTEEARHLLQGKTNLRLLQAPLPGERRALHMHRIGGGMLVQTRDPGVVSTAEWKLVTKTPLPEGGLEQLRFAMQAAALLKSNAIALTKDFQLLGAGTGQMSRVDATRHAIEKAKDRAAGSYLGSDAFFPFDDCVRLAAEAGVVAIAQPGGSVRDNESIAACDELGLAMVFTGQRHFRH